MSDTLQHIGILGMRWGRRKGSSRPSTSSADHEMVVQLRKKKLHEMSNKEIQAIATRMNLEGQYKNLHPGKIARGKKRVQNVLKFVGAATAAYTTIQAAIPLGKLIIEKTKWARDVVKAAQGM